MKDVRLDKRFGVQFAYILDCINVEDENGNYIENVDDRKKIEYVFQGFSSYDSPSERKRIPNLQARIADWLRGLPSEVKIAFADYEIESVGKSWGFCKTPKQTEKFVENWWSVIAFRLLQLRDKICK